MNAAQVVILIGGSLAMLSALIAWMHGANKREQRLMQRRYEEWIANGSIPEEKPNFFMGSAGSNTGGG